MENKFGREVLEKLNLLVKLMAYSVTNPNAPQTESILRLKKIGLKPKQIADALNTTQNYVNMIISKQRRK